MTRSTFTTGAVLCAVLLAGGAAVAKSADRGMPLLFDAMDANGDGQITRDEMASQRMARFEDADADGDGALSFEELEAEARTRATDHVERMMERLDSNEDGKLTPAELAEAPGADRRFRRMDRDGDGAITKAEFDAARDRMAKHRDKMQPTE